MRIRARVLTNALAKCLVDHVFRLISEAQPGQADREICLRLPPPQRFFLFEGLGKGAGWHLNLLFPCASALFLLFVQNFPMYVWCDSTLLGGRLLLQSVPNANGFAIVI